VKVLTSDDWVLLMVPTLVVAPQPAVAETGLSAISTFLVASPRASVICVE
jgi:hypothetical protein